ncbi:hypothetical protein MEW_06088, partial [Candida albicans P60002]
MEPRLGTHKYSQ